MGTATMFLWAAAAIGGGADDGSNAGRLIDRLAACRAVAGDAERLRCFDAAAAAVVDARRTNDIVVLDKAEVRRTKRSLFGFSLPSIRLFGDRDDDQALKQVTGTLSNAATLPGGLLRFQLDGDASGSGVWETTEASMVMLRRGDTVTVKAGSLGSYVATAPGRRAVRVRRVR